MKYPVVQTIFAFVIILVSLTVGSTYYYYSPFHKSVKRAVAVIYPTKGNNASGVVTFLQQKDGLYITGSITGITPGRHGFHIHEFGDCSCEGSVCAGDHFNPTHTSHGSPESNNRHIGDLGNISTDAQGNVSLNFIDTHVKLNGPHSIIGRAIIIHAHEDDYLTEPTGHAGARIGCGVIGIARD
ncbi:MAG: superoxide dismutase family protein [bacterium]|nr:superoxide dismutase family protein [bacterium]